MFKRNKRDLEKIQKKVNNKDFSVRGDINKMVISLLRQSLDKGEVRNLKPILGGECGNNSMEFDLFNLENGKNIKMTIELDY